MIRDDGFYTHEDRDSIKRMLPSPMTEKKRWCCFKVTEPNEKGKRQKKPCYENGQGADHTPELLTEYGDQRVGFLFEVDDEDAEYQQIFVDGDGLPDDPELADFYKEIYDQLKKNTYVEESLSAELEKKFSFHAFGYAKLPVRSICPKTKKKKTARSNSQLKIELYDRGRWCLTTGISPTYIPMSNIQPIINKIIAKIDELEALKKANKKAVSESTIKRRTKLLGEANVEEVALSDLDIERVKQRLNWHRQPGNTNLLHQAGDYKAYQRVVYSLKSMIDKEGKRVFKDSDIVRFLSNQPGFDNKALNDVMNGFNDAVPDNQAGNFFALSNERGFPKEIETPSVEKKEPVAEQEKIDIRKHFYEFSPDKMNELKLPADLTDYFPPIGESNIICGKPGAGKSSFIMDCVAEATHKDLKVLIWSFDLRHEFLAQYLAAYGAQAQHVIIVDKPLPLEVIETLIKEKKITCFVPDPFLDFFGMASPRFMTNPLTGKEQEFNPDQQWAWVQAFRWFRFWADTMKLSVLGTLHSAKGKFSHDLPHSSKLPAYLWKWWILYRKGHNMKEFPEAWLAKIFENSEPNARMLYHGKVRGSTELRHMIYSFGDEVDKKILTEGAGLVPRIIVDRQYPDEAEFFHNLENNDGTTIDGVPLKKQEEDECPTIDMIQEMMKSSSYKEWISTRDLCIHFNIRDEQSRALIIYRLMLMVRDKRIELKETRAGCFSWRFGCLGPLDWKEDLLKLDQD